MDWIKVTLRAPGTDPEILLAWVGELDFDAFETEADVLHAYVPHARFNEADFREKAAGFPFEGNLSWESTLIHDKNWNETWERQYEPVRVEQRVTIRAPFHAPAPVGDIDLVIEPKMSFGTGHHPTTTLMIRLMLLDRFDETRVLDLGCGSGVLGILAAKLGAQAVLGIDIDDWAVENTLENCERNEVTNFRVEKGDARAIEARTFDRVLANINRNILVKEMPVLSGALESGAVLYLSGFLVQDVPVIREAAAQAGLSHELSATDHEWAAITFKKP